LDEVQTPKIKLKRGNGSFFLTYFHFYLDKKGKGLTALNYKKTAFEIGLGEAQS
jgi:hypothetical protein